MAVLDLLFFFSTISIYLTITAAKPSPGYYPSYKVPTIDFNKAFTNRWGAQHQTLNKSELTIWLDRYTGSGFKSLTSYNSGYFGANIKLHPGYTAGIITSLYLSNNEAYPGKHDEIDIEFLGTTKDKPYVLQTNVFIRGSGDGNIIGRDNKIHLWFDPTKDFHHYAILWNPREIIFYVDDIPIRRYPKKIDSLFPARPMWVYGSIWDASSWATENGKYKADYKYEPFYARYKNFKIGNAPRGSPSGPVGLSRQQYSAMSWVQSNYLVYDYCHDKTRDRKQIPECSKISKLK
ncbi:probable xyloglucan endotransglucosylase/hydrolase protein 32 [Impatiens glandulifera]|uniref:probable xyloglucan endotransglucosylase/hydrolase protein 32 n=1 Tax=Impatiens glandulifera TaxID=253017 RepID=UPI001FB0FFDB|nr:probable xyloglucan endotransglucosylase/hydrolase protein 32 [Impatiens glandulifera]